MRFEEIGAVTTVAFDMDDLHALALVCRVAAETGDAPVQTEAYGVAFTAATLIARTHGDMSASMREHLAAIHQRIKDGAR